MSEFNGQSRAAAAILAHRRYLFPFRDDSWRPLFRPHFDDISIPPRPHFALHTPFHFLFAVPPGGRSIHHAFS